MPYKKGFVLIFPVVIFLIVILVIGFIFANKQGLKIPKPIESAETELEYNVLYFKDIIQNSVDPEKNIGPFYISNTKGKNETLLKSEINSLKLSQLYLIEESPDRSKLLIEADYDSGIAELNHGYFLLETGKYPIAKQINLNISEKHGSEYSIRYSYQPSIRWSSDSRKIVFVARDVAYNSDNPLNCADCDGPSYIDSKNIVFSYDIETNKTEKLFENVSDKLEVLFYNPEKKFLAFREKEDLVQVNLENSQQSKFKNIAPLTEVHNGEAFTFWLQNAYSALIDSGEFIITEESTDEGKKFRLRSIYEPEKVVSEFFFPGEEQSIQLVNFSPDKEMVLYLDASNYSEGIDKVTYYLFSKSGQKLYTWDVENTTFNTSVVFSDDSKYVFFQRLFDLDGPNFYDGNNPNPVGWQVYATTTGQKILETDKSDRLGNIVLVKK